jgi:UDP-N-acetylglucosamine 2-epimerase (non-hydrolysing)
MKVQFIFGTRPEAIKLCPLVRALASRPDEFEVHVCVTAQHRQMLDQVLDVFDVTPDADLDLMQPGQSLAQSASRILAALEPVLHDVRPDLVLVQGDTTTTLAAALAAFYARIPVAHVEAGLRTWDLAQPFPEEMNRVVAGRLASLHFAATPWAAANLANEGVPPQTIHVTGNTGIDAVLQIKEWLQNGRLKPPTPIEVDPKRKLILVTAHRRESFGEGFERICAALLELASRGDVEIVYPVHPNPNVREPVERLLIANPRIRLIDPLDYVSFVDLMRRAWFLLTDSGGVQEEGPSLGKPILVMREKTERPEAVEAGTVRLVGSDARRIVEESRILLDDAAEYTRRSRIHNPYGDGQACARIAQILQRHSRQYHSLQAVQKTPPGRTS